MTQNTIETRLREIVCANLGVDAEQVTPDAQIIADLGADSFDTISLCLDCEDAFGIEISDEALEGARTFGDWVGVVVLARAAAPAHQGEAKEAGNG